MLVGLSALSWSPLEMLTRIKQHGSLDGRSPWHYLGHWSDPGNRALSPLPSRKPVPARLPLHLCDTRSEPLWFHVLASGRDEGRNRGEQGWPMLVSSLTPSHGATVHPANGPITPDYAHLYGRVRSHCALAEQLQIIWSGKLKRDRCRSYVGFVTTGDTRAVYSGSKSVHLHFVFDLRHLKRDLIVASNSSYRDNWSCDLPDSLLRPSYEVCWSRLGAFFQSIAEVEENPGPSIEVLGAVAAALSMGAAADQRRTSARPTLRSPHSPSRPGPRCVQEHQTGRDRVVS